jgi:hypothetical protein
VTIPEKDGYDSYLFAGGVVGVSRSISNMGSELELGQLTSKESNRDSAER